LDDPPTARFVSRGGEKLAHALQAFALDPTGLVAADLGASTGGFTDCLLRAGAARVYALDTAYGQLAWSLRNDPRVVVIERTNALHAQPPQPLDLVTVDLGWTPQRLAIPAALRWLGPRGRIISLIKPHYEHKDRGGTLPRGGVLDETVAAKITLDVLAAMPTLGVRVVAHTRSPILGGKGNAEWLALLEPADPRAPG
jgi:23S rRNA (cytidine1920-2'-O)/16S rRNA (cytidine1409-2'-O)-methyltransferase